MHAKSSERTAARPRDVRADGSGRLEPGARTMAAVKLRTPADLDAELFATWLRLARELEERS
ncbi:hypothetical protein [Streptomyces olivoreticuli]|uniref:hypothetical protein n=1 Tax=Streptomyces olivoreticuli TaxID=68246 RepID=UPI000E288A5A|nr:hypothetical protein [Streptomyces olivoreticuli]